MAYKNKTYVAFDADNDIRYYRLMTAWKKNGNLAFNFHDAHDANNIRDWSSEETIKRRLRERFANTKILIILIGDSTKNLFKYVRWEIEYSLKSDIPIIAVNLNNSIDKDKLCPPILNNELVLFVPFKQKIIIEAMKDWPNEHKNLKNKNMLGHYFYPQKVYDDLKIII